MPLVFTLMCLLLQLSESKQQLQISAERLNAAETLIGHKKRSVQAVEQYAACLEHELSQLRGTHEHLRTQYDADMLGMEQQVSDLQVLDAILLDTHNNAVPQLDDQPRKALLLEQALVCQQAVCFGVYRSIAKV